MPRRPTCCFLAIAGCNLGSPRQLWDAGSLPTALAITCLDSHILKMTRSRAPCFGVFIRELELTLSMSTISSQHARPSPETTLGMGKIRVRDMRRNALGKQFIGLSARGN